jgi:hypothetical protein
MQSEWQCSCCFAHAEKEAPSEPVKAVCGCNARLVVGISELIATVKEQLAWYAPPRGWSALLSLPRATIGEDGKVTSGLVQLSMDREDCRSLAAVWATDFANIEWRRILDKHVAEWAELADETIRLANNPALGMAMWRDNKETETMGEMYEWE